MVDWELAAKIYLNAGEINFIIEIQYKYNQFHWSLVFCKIDNRKQKNSGTRGLFEIHIVCTQKCQLYWYDLVGLN